MAMVRGFVEPIARAAHCVPWRLNRLIGLQMEERGRIVTNLNAPR